MVEGVLFALGATIFFAVGNILEKRGVDTLAGFSVRHPAAVINSLLRSKMWVAGAIASALGLLSQLIALAHLSISLVQSVGIAGIVLLLVLSHIHLGEALTSGERQGIVVAIAGFLFVSLSLTHSADVPGIRIPALAVPLAAVVTVAAIVATFVVCRAFAVDRGVGFGIGAGLCYGLTGIGAKGVSAVSVEHGVLHSFAPLAGSVFPYIFLGSWVIGLSVFQFGIQRSRVAIVGPLSTMVSSVYVVAVGTPLYGERLPSSPLLLISRLSGFALLIVGSVLVARGGGATAQPSVVTESVWPSVE